MTLRDDGARGDGARGRRLTEEMVFMRTKCNRLELIKNLNLWGNDLDNIEVLRYMPNLEVLSLSVNRVSTLADLRNLSKLSELYLRKNYIEDLAEVQHLTNLRKLKVLWLNDNPCANLPHYRQYVLHYLPNLAKLDSQDVTDDERRQAQHSSLADVMTRVIEDADVPDVGVMSADTWATNGSRGGGERIDRGERRHHTNPARQQMSHPALERSRTDLRQEDLRQEEDHIGRRFSTPGDLQAHSRGMQHSVNLDDDYDRRTGTTGRGKYQESPSQFYDDRPLGGAHAMRNQQYQDDISPEITPRGDAIDQPSYAERGYGNHMGDDGERGYSHHADRAWQERGDPYNAWHDSPPRRGGDHAAPGANRLGSQENLHVANSRDGGPIRSEPRRSTSTLSTTPPDNADGYIAASSSPPPVNAAGRADNILCAVLALIKELDRQGLELVRRAIEQRQHEL